VTTKTRISPQRRLKAARLVRQGTPVAAVERETGISQRTLWRWLQDDGDFLTLVHGAGTLQVGPVRIVADYDAPQVDDAPDESQVWIADGDVIGSLHVEDARFLRAVFVTTADRARAELDAGRLPHDPHAATFPLRADALPALAEPENVRLLTALCSDDAARSFAAFLGVWKFRSTEDKSVHALGDVMWEGQHELAALLATDPYVFLLKARKLGQSTLAIAYAAYVTRIRDEHARVHLFSYRERASKRLLEQVKFGLERLPDWLRLPVERETQLEVVYAAGNDDQRTVVSYPMSKVTAIEETSTHALLDEFGAWPDNATTYEKLEPTMTAVGATAHLVTTGYGPVNFSAELWQLSKDDLAPFTPVFLAATARPGRTPEFMERKRRSMTASGFRSEYALTEADALAGPTEREFSSDDIDACTRYARYGSQSPLHWPLNQCQVALPRRTKNEPLRESRYIIACDIGKKDATVVTVLDVTTTVFHVAGYWRFVGLSYPAIQNAIETIAASYPGAPVVVEANSIGQAVIDNLETANRVIPFHTGETSKARAIEKLASALQSQHLQFPKNDLTQLYAELVGYVRPDDHVVQDSVMALALAIDQAPEAYSAKNRPGRVMSVVYV
jgi:hypothetical protein